MPGSGPRVIDDHDGVVEIRPGLDLIILVTQAQPAIRVGPVCGSPLRSIGRRERAGKLAPSFGVRAGAARLPSTNNERKYQRPSFTSGTTAVHNGPRPFPPAGDRHAAAEDRLFARISGVSDRRILRARVVGRKHAPARLTGYFPPRSSTRTGLLSGPCGLQPTDRIAGAGQAGQGAIAAVGLGLGQPARPGVFSVPAPRKSRPSARRQPWRWWPAPI